MTLLLQAAAAADHLSQRLGADIHPKLVSDLIYRRIIPPSLVTTVAGRKLIDESDLPTVGQILVNHGYAPSNEEGER